LALDFNTTFPNELSQRVIPLKEGDGENNQKITIEDWNVGSEIFDATLATLMFDSKDNTWILNIRASKHVTSNAYILD